MCSARKRSSCGADDSSDDDFDYSLQKRLRTDCRKNNIRNSKGLPKEKSRRKHEKGPPSQQKNSVTSNNSVCRSITSVDSPTSSLIDDCLGLEESHDSKNEADNSLSSSHIISDVLDAYDECDDVSCHIKLQDVTKSPTQRPFEAQSPQKQSSLLEYFNVKRNGIILTKETASITSKTSTRPTNGTSFKMYRSQSDQMVFKKPNESKANSSFYNKSNRDCPFYKKIPGTSITVDAFQYGNIPGCQAYFLSHFHYDHYIGLSKHFRNPIYCSQATGNLVCKKLGVAPEYVHKLALNVPTIIENVKVTLLDANHCPGSVMFLFVSANGVYLHTGDFRACQEMERIPLLNKIHVNQLYLDTTYCSQTYKFPSQDEVVSYAAQKAKEAMDINPRTLVVCGSYTIGKEKIFLAIAKVLGSKVFVSKDKKNILDCLESTEISDILSTEESNARVHVLPMMKITFKGMNEYLRKYSYNFNSILGFKPTGWTYSDSMCSLTSIKPQISGQVTIYGIPYSEHSSFTELKRFVQFIRPDKVIPTVFGGAGQRISDMKDVFKDWLRN